MRTLSLRVSSRAQRTSCRALLAACIFFVAAAIPAATRAFLYIHTNPWRPCNAGVPARWNPWDLPVAWRQANGTADCDGEFDAVEQGFRTWEATRVSYFDSERDAVTPAPTPNFNANDGINVVGWVDAATFERLTGYEAHSDHGFGWLGGTLAVCFILPDGINYTTGRITDADIMFNDEVGWSTDPQSCWPPSQDVQSVATHEIGHFLGLDDLYNPGDDNYLDCMGSGNENKTMYGKSSWCSTIQRDLESDDINGIAFLYPRRLDSRVTYIRTKSPGYHQFTPMSPSWTLVGARPPVGQQWFGIALYTDSDYLNEVASSNVDGDQADFIVTDRQHYDPQVSTLYPWTAGGDGGYQYRIRYEQATGINVGSANPQVTMSVEDPAYIYDVYLTGGTSYDFELDNRGNGDLGFGLFDSNSQVYYAGRTQAAVAADAAGGGGDESFTYTAPRTDHYGLVVWRDSNWTTPFVLSIGPARTALTEDVSRFAATSPGYFQFTPDPAQTRWAVVGAKTPASGQYRLRLYENTFFTILGALSQRSASSPGASEFVAIDWNQRAPATLYPMVQKIGGDDGYRVHWEDGSQLSLAAPATGVVLGWDEAARIFDVDLAAGKTYEFALTTDNAGGARDVGLALFAPGTSLPHMQGPGGAAVLVNEAAGGGAERLTYRAQATGSHGLLVWGDQGNLAYTCTISAYEEPTALASDYPVAGTATGTPSAFRFNQTNAHWAAVGVRPPAGGDYDLRLYADAHHQTQLEVSNVQGGAVDLIACDFVHAARGEYYPAIQYVSGPGAPFAVEWSGESRTLSPGTTNGPFALGPGAVVAAWDVTLTVSERYAIELDVQSGSADLGLALFKPDGADRYFGRGAAVRFSDQNGAGGDETIEYSPPFATETYGLVVFSNGGGTEATTFKLNISQDYDGLTTNVPADFTTSPGLFRLNQTAARWSVVALRPTAGDDWDLALHKDPFGSNLIETSTEGTSGSDRVEFIVGDFNHASHGSYYARSTFVSGTANRNYRMEWEENEGTLSLTQENGLGPFPSGDVAVCLDVPLAGGTEYTLELRWDGTAGNADVGMALFKSDPDDFFFSRDQAVALADANGGGEGERFDVTAAASDTYALVVWLKSGSSGDDEAWVRVGPRTEELADGSSVTSRDAPGYFQYAHDESDPDRWTVTGVRPATGSNWNLALYDNGYFNPPSLATSAAVGGGGVEFLAHSFIDGDDGTYFVEAAYGSGSVLDYRVQWTDGEGTLSLDAPNGPFTFATTDVAKIWDVALTAATPVTFVLAVTAGTQDLGLALVRSTESDAVAGRGEALVVADQAGAGGREVLTYTPNANDTYGLLVFSKGGSAATSFTLDTPNPPVVTITAPLSSWPNSSHWSGTHDIRWTATDADGDPMTIAIAVSADGGQTWAALASGEENDGRYTWNTRNHADGSHYRLRITADDGMVPGVGTTGDFTVDNTDPTWAAHAGAERLTAGDGVETAATVTWAAANDALSSPALFHIYHDTRAAIDYSVPDYADVGIYTQAVANLARGSAHCFAVRARDQADLPNVDDNAVKVALYLSPGNGAQMTMNWLVANSGGIVTGAAPSYTLNGSVVVAAGDVLTIPAGTTVTANDTHGWIEIVVFGTLDASGTTFASAGTTAGDWGGIRFMPPSVPWNAGAGTGCRIKDSTIRYAEDGVAVLGDPGPLLFPAPLIAASTITDHANHGVRLFHANPTVKDNVITDNGADGISVEFTGPAQILFNTIQRNEDDGIGLAHSGPVIKNNDIQQNRFGIRAAYEGAFMGQQPVIQFNTIANNDSTGVHLEVVGLAPDIRWNQIATNTYGVVTDLGANVNPLTQNNIQGNTSYGAQNRNDCVADPGQTVAAPSNWWGHLSGPSGQGLGGSGDRVNPPCLNVQGQWLNAAVAIAAAGSAVDDAHTDGPGTITVAPGTPIGPLHGRVFEAGVTPAPGPATSILGYLAIGPAGTTPSMTAPWQTRTVSYAGEYQGYDRYDAVITGTLAPGDYDYTFGFYPAGGNPNQAVYSDLDGNDTGAGGGNGYSSVRAGKALVMPALQGRLALATGPRIPAPRAVAPQAANVEFLHLALTTTDYEAIRVLQATFTASGTGNDATGVTNLRLYLDEGNAVFDGTEQLLAGGGVYGGDNGPLTFILNRQIPAATREIWFLVGNLTATPQDGHTFAARVAVNAQIAAQGVTSGAPIQPSGAPVQGAAATVAAPGAVSVAAGAANPPAAQVFADGSHIPMLQLRVAETSGNEAAVATELDLVVAGSGDDREDVDGAHLVLDADADGQYDAGSDSLLAGPVLPSADDGVVTFSGLGRRIAASAQERWLVVYDLGGSAATGVTFQVGLAANGDLDATGEESGGALAVGGAPVDGNAQTVIARGTLAVARGAADPGDHACAAGATARPLLQLHLTETSGDEAVHVDTLRVAASGSGNETTGVSAVRLHADRDGDGAVSAGDSLLAGPFTYAADDGTLEIVFATAPVIGAGAAADWLLSYDLAGAAGDGDEFVLTVPAAGVSAHGAVTDVRLSPAGLPLTSGRLRIATRGAVALALGEFNPAGQALLTAASNVPVLALEATESTDFEAVAIASLRVTGAGTLDEAADIAAVRLFRDVDRDGEITAGLDTVLAGPAVFGADNGSALLAPAAPETLQSGASVQWLVAVDLAGSAADGETLRLRLAENAHVAVSGVETGEAIAASGAPIEGESSSILETATLALARGPVNPDTTRALPASAGVPVLQLALGETSGHEAVAIASLRVTASGSGDDLHAIASAHLVLDVDGNGSADPGEPEIAVPTTYASDDGELNFVLNPRRPIAAATSERWLVTYDLAPDAPDRALFAARVAAAGDVVARGVETELQVMAGGTFPVAGSTLLVTESSALRVALGPASPVAGSALPGAAGVEVVQLTIEERTGNEGALIDTLRVTGSGSGHEENDILAVALYRDVNANGILDPGVDLLQGTRVYLEDDGTVSFAGAPLATLAAGGSAAWLVVYDLAAGAADGATFRAGMGAGSDVAARGAETFLALAVTGPPVYGADLTVAQAGALVVERGAASPANHPVAPGETGVEVLQLRAAETTQHEAACITSIRLTASGTADDAADLTAVRLYRDTNADGLLESDADVLVATHAGGYPGDNGALVLTPADSLVVAAGAEEHWLLAYDVAASPGHGETFMAGITGGTAIAATGIETGLALAVAAPAIASDTLRVVQPAALAVARGPALPPAQTISNNVIGLPVFQLAVSETTGREAAVVDSLFLRAAGTADDATDILAAGVKLYIDDGNGRVDSTDVRRGLATGFDADNGVVRFRFGDLSALIVPPAATVHLLVTYDLAGTAANGETFSLALENGAALRAGGSYTGGTLAVSGAPVVGNVMTVGATAVAAGAALPRVLALHPNRPNPFHPATEIRFDLPAPAVVDLAIYDVAGRLVRSLVAGRMPAGYHAAVWDGKDDRGHAMASGVYVYRLETQGKVLTRKLALIR